MERIDKIINKLDKRLINIEQAKPYKLKYYHCKKYGHKRTNCPDKDSSPKIQNPQNNQGREKNKYKHCGLFDRSDNIYWDLDKNVYMRPDGQIHSLLYKIQKISKIVKVRTDMVM